MKYKNTSLIIYLIAPIVFIALSYLAVGFIELTLDPYKMSLASRKLVIAMSMVSGVGVIFVLLIRTIKS